MLYAVTNWHCDLVVEIDDVLDVSVGAVEGVVFSAEVLKLTTPLATSWLYRLIFSSFDTSEDFEGFDAPV